MITAVGPQWRKSGNESFCGHFESWMVHSPRIASVQLTLCMKEYLVIETGDPTD